MAGAGIGRGPPRLTMPLQFQPGPSPEDFGTAPVVRHVYIVMFARIVPDRLDNVGRVVGRFPCPRKITDRFLPK